MVQRFDRRSTAKNVVSSPLTLNNLCTYPQILLITMFISCVFGRITRKNLIGLRGKITVLRGTITGLRGTITGLRGKKLLQAYELDRVFQPLTLLTLLTLLT